MEENTILNTESSDQSQIHAIRLRVGIKVHWIVYIIINLLLFAIYWLTGRGYPWFFWVLAGWGIGLSIHSLSVRSILHYSLPEDQAIRIHGGAQLSVMLFLVFVDYFTGYGINWSIYPCLVLIYAWLNHFIYYRFFNKISKSEDGSDAGLSGYQRLMRYYTSGMPDVHSKDATKRAKRAIGNQIGFRYHLLAFIVITLILLMLDINIRPGYWWFYWPCLSWGMIVVEHGFIARMVKHASLFHRLRRNAWLIYPFVACVYLLSIDYIPDKHFNWSLYASVPIMIVSIGIGLIVAAVKKENFQQYPPTQNISSEKTDIPSEHRDISLSIKLYCPSCGSEITRDQKTCEFCGKDV